MNKQEARKYALNLRLSFDSQIKSKDVIEQIKNSNILDKYNNIGIYFPIGKELNIMDLLKIYPNKKFYLPITKEEISFVEYKIEDKLIDGPFHTKEPIGKIIERDTIDCFLIPCVAVNNNDYRLGYGKGYYDRYLNDYKGFKIGICYKKLRIDFKEDSFDLKLDKVIEI